MVAMTACVGCEGKPSADNNPCALCGGGAPALSEDGLPPLDEHRIIELWDSTASGGMVGRYIRFAKAIARDAVAADRLARRPRVTPDPALTATLDEAAKTRSTVALLPDGEPVFINYGDQPEDTTDLCCTACGGSGHIDDQRDIESRASIDGQLTEAPSAVKQDAQLARQSQAIDERHEFERHMSQRGDAALYIGDGLYNSGAVQDQWEAWLARAGIAAHAKACQERT